MDYVSQHNIGIEVNLTSNLQTSVVPSYAAHPLHKFLARKLLVSINSDDPVISGIDLRHEYTIAAPAAGLQEADLKQVRLNGILMAFLPEADKQALLAQRSI
jgi:adenosine deaminase